MFFDQFLYHASFGGGSRRRMFTLNFASKPTLEAHRAFHQGLYEGHLKYQGSNPFYSTHQVYYPEFLAGTHPRRQQVVKPLIEWGFR